MLIPGSRGDYSYLVLPTRLSHDTLLSLAHGAGRKWTRSYCKDHLFKLMTPTQMSRTVLGSRVICNDKQLIYEEAPQAYKGVDSVVQALLDKDLCFETLRASGPGGQHANKRLARALLAHKLASAATENANAARSERWLQHYGVERGNAGRVFRGEGFVETSLPTPPAPSSAKLKHCLI